MKKKLGVVIMLFVLSGCTVTAVSSLPMNELDYYKTYHPENWAFKRVYVDNKSMQTAVANALGGLKCRFALHTFEANYEDGYIVSSTALVNQPITEVGKLYLLVQLHFQVQPNETEIGVNWLIVRKLKKDERFYVEETSSQKHFDFDFDYLKSVTESYDKCENVG